MMDNSHVNTILDRAKKAYREQLDYLSVTEVPLVKLVNTHQRVFKKFDCLDCGNCCKTTPAIVTNKDAKRIANHLRISKKQFSRKYLLDDLTGDMVWNHVPCRFLSEDNKCSIYEVRPLACRRYPHTDEQAYNSRPEWNAKNTLVCPAAQLVVEQLMAK